MLKLTLLLMVAGLPCIADVMTFSVSTMQYTDGDVLNFPPPFVTLPGFNSSLGTLEAVKLSSTFSLDRRFIIEVGTDTQNANFSVVYTPSLGVYGPVPYTPPTFPSFSAPGGVGVTLNLNASGVGTASQLSAHCCDQRVGNYVAVIPVTAAAATNSYDFVDLDPFTSDAEVAFFTTGAFGLGLASLTGPTSNLGFIEYWAGEGTYDATITYTFAPTPDPSSVILMSTVLLGLAFVARKRIAKLQAECPVSRHNLR